MLGLWSHKHKPEKLNMLFNGWSVYECSCGRFFHYSLSYFQPEANHWMEYQSQKAIQAIKTKLGRKQ